jgi:hypothetical protein
MPRNTRHFFVIIILILLSFAPSMANAATLVIGSNGDLSRYPFGADPGAASSAFPDFAAGGVYQQVYAGSVFSGPVTITQIAFASKSVLTSGPGLATYNFNVGLSTTAVGPGGLSTNLATNRGADFAQVFTGILPVAITANNQFDVIINITPFTYNPANGNLLLDVSFNAPAQFSAGPVMYLNAGFSPSSSRAANPSGNAGGGFVDGFGLFTRFTTVETAQLTLSDLEQTYDGNPKVVSVISNPPDVPVVVTYDGSVTPPVNAGTYAVAATVNDPGFVGQASGNLIINRAEQQIDFDVLPARTFNDPDFGVNAAASSGLPVGFVANGNCTINGLQVHLTGAGTCTVTASQGGDANHNPAAAVTRTFSISRADQQITFSALPDAIFGDTDFNLSATSTSNLAVGFAAAGNCTVTGGQVHLTGAGTCTITASQEGDANYQPAATVAHTFAIARADQQISFAALADKTFGDADFEVSATASSDLAVTFRAAGNCSIAGTTVHLTGAGTCTITASQEGDANHNAATEVARTFAIARADQQIDFGALPDKAFGDADFEVSAVATSDLPVSFAASGNCSLTGAQVHINGAGTCSITASQAGDSNHNAAAAVTRTFSINRANQSITFGILPDKRFGDADFDVSATASSELAVSFSATGSCTINGATVHLTGAGNCTVTAAQAGNENYNAATPVLRVFVIARAEQQISFGALTDKTFGDADFGVSATASSNLSVSFSAAGNCSVSGATVHLTGAGTCTITATQAGDDNHNSAESVSRTFNVATAATAAAVVSSQNPSALGQNVTFTVTVTSTAGTPGGTVQFTDNETNLGGPAALNEDGIATVSTASLTGGTHAIAASYGGDANFASTSAELGGGQVVDQPGISINDVSISEGALGTRNATFTVNLSSASAVPVVVHYQTVDNTATAPDDYVAIADTELTIPAGATSATITVQVKGDAVFEGNETFFVDLTSATGGAAIDGRGVAKIGDDDLRISDFDHDGVADASVWDVDGVWRSINSSDGQPRTGVQWGSSADPLNDIAVPGDYDGDGVSDSAVWRQSDGTWYILESSSNAQVARNWGLPGDVPVADDYDGDGKTDLAVWRPSDGNWYILNSSDGQVSTVNWGLGSLGDMPVRGRFNGDNRADFAVFRRSEGNWYILSSDRNSTRVEHWGIDGDTLVPGDYDGDSKTDIAVWRRDEGTWYIHNSSDNSLTVRVWGSGALGDLPVVADYDGDGKTDIGVWRPAEGNWYIIKSSTETPFTLNLGQPGAVPLPAAHLPL